MQKCMAVILILLFHVFGITLNNENTPETTKTNPVLSYSLIGKLLRAK